MADKKMDFNSILSQLEDTLELYLVKKAPNLPKTIKDLIVVLTPWFTLLGIIFSIPLVFVAFGLSTLIGPLSVITGPLPAISYGAGYTFAMLILAFALVGIVESKKTKEKCELGSIESGIAEVLNEVITKEEQKRRSLLVKQMPAIQCLYELLYLLK